MAEAYFFDDGVLTVETDEGSEDVTVAGISEITIDPEWEIAEKYTADSGFREAVKQYEHTVAVDVGYMDFNMDAAQQWLGGDGPSATSSTDTSDPQLYTVKVVSTSVGGAIERECEVEKVVFPNFPLVDGSAGEFEEYSLSGSGRSVTSLEDISSA